MIHQRVSATVVLQFLFSNIFAAFYYVGFGDDFIASLPQSIIPMKHALAGDPASKRGRNTLDISRLGSSPWGTRSRGSEEAIRDATIAKRDEIDFFMVFIGRKGLREAFTFELTKFKLQRNTVNRGTSSPKAKLRKKRMRHTVGHNMRNRKRHETVLDRFAKAFGNSPRIATHRVMDSVDEKEESLPMFLF